jgi:BMFP domain-containing protein YqiC
MTDSARAYFDSFLGMAGDPGRRARDFAGKVREDLRSGSENLRSGAEQVREHGTRTASDIGRLIRAELEAGLTRIGVATQADLDDLNLRLEHAEEQIRDLRIRLAEAEARTNVAEKLADRPAAEPPAPAADDRPGDEEEDA